MVHRIQGTPPHIPSVSNNSAGPDCAEGFHVVGNTVKTGDYTIVFGNKFNDDAVKVYNKRGELIGQAGGDPHFTTPDGKADFHNDMTLNLADGTKMTFTTTADERNEKDPTYLKTVTITKPGSGAVVASYDGNGNPSLQQLPRSFAEALDRRTRDGLELAAGRDGSVRVMGGPKIEGDMGNLDRFRAGQRWGDRPDIGLPGRRHHGPLGGRWDFGHHAPHRPHHEQCEHNIGVVRDLMHALSYYKRQVHAHSSAVRLDAYEQIARIEGRLDKMRIEERLRDLA